MLWALAIIFGLVWVLGLVTATTTGARKVALVLSLLVAGAAGLAPSEASARGGDLNGFSLGLVLGDPSGLTLRGGLDERNAIQAAIGFSPIPGGAVAVMVDWTYDAWDFLRNNRTASLLFYFGLGAKAEWFTGHYWLYGGRWNRGWTAGDSHFGLGLRGLVGLRLAFRNAPFDLFFEIAPVGVTLVVPDTGAFYDFDAAIGFRYRF
jgi:hypothetical protein